MRVPGVLFVTDSGLAYELIVGIPESLAVESAGLYPLYFGKDRLLVPFSHAFLGSVVADPIDGRNQKEVGNGNAPHLTGHDLVDDVPGTDPFGHLKQGHGQTKLLLVHLDGIVEILSVEELMKDGFGGTQIGLLVDHPAFAAALGLPSGLGVEFDPVGARVIIIALSPALSFDDFPCEFGFSIHACHYIWNMKSLQGYS